MSIIAGWLSKIALSKIISYIKNNKKEFIMFGIVMIFIFIIFYLLIRIKMHKNAIDKLEDEIEILEMTNALYQNQIIDNEKYIKELLSYTNSYNIIIKATNYSLPLDIIESYEAISNDFMKTQETN